MHIINSFVLQIPFQLLAALLFHTMALAVLFRPIFLATPQLKEDNCAFFGYFQSNCKLKKNKCLGTYKLKIDFILSIDI